MSPRSRLAAGWLTLFVVGTDLFVVSPLLPPIAHELRLSAAAAGLCATVFSLTYMTGAPVFGHLADRFGRRRVLTICLAAFALANLLTAAAAGFVWLIAARAAAGAAAAGVTPLIYAAVGDEAPPARRASWMAFAVSGLLLALSVGAPAGALIGAAWGWRAPFLVLATASLVLVAGNRMAWPRDALIGGAEAMPARLAVGGRLAIRLLPTVLWATALYGVYTYLGLGLAAAGFAPAQVARVISLYGIAALAGTLLGGRLADAIGVRKTMLWSLVGLTVCLAGLSRALRAEWSAEVVVALASVWAQLFFPAQQAALTAAFPGRRATALAWNNSALFLGISLGSLIGGQAMSRAGFGATALIGSELAGLALVTAVLLGNRQSISKTPDNIATERS